MESSTERLITQLKAFADPVRLRLLALCVRGECSVTELTRVLSLSQPRISQHLKQLCDAGLLERFRDGHFVYYRVPLGSEQAAQRRRLFALLPDDEPAYDRDFDKLCALRESTGQAVPEKDNASVRSLHRALIELTVTMPLGDLVDIGSGRGRILKLLGSRAHRAVGVDIDADARQIARAELLLAGIENCSLRHGDMYELPFADGEFDTVILDDVLGDAKRPMVAIGEASRILRPGGRLLVLAQTANEDADALRKRIAVWCGASGLRLAPPRQIPAKNPEWLLAVASAADDATVAA
ncbi:MAG: metalloregulator ArsR/SmtB family transcription factor [Woeseiaceae bacterium]|nr:metalloregulator ArsR/SmtB family transcription factor [Woeseiaceae bacterium]